MLQIYRNDTIISVTDALGDTDEAYVSVDDVMLRLLEMEAAGLIRIEPNAESLRRMALKAGIQAYFMKERDELGIRKYVSDRRGGRINAKAARIGALLDVHRREAILSIQRFMNIEGPAAYKSQAELLAALDPTVDAELIARTAANAVSDAVRTGIAKGRAAAAEDIAKHG